MNGWRRSTVWVVGCVVVFVLVGVCIWGWHAESGKRAADARMRAAWRQQNAASLLGLSAATGLSADEAARLHRAGDDPGQIRQALIEIHELRLADVSRDLQDAQRRKAELAGPDGYQVTPDEPPQADLVALVNQDEETATSQIARYAAALGRIRRWKPVPYAEFAASRTGDREVVASRGPGPADVDAEKPDPRVPARADQGRRGAVEDELPLPSGPEIAESALHPVVTVYAGSGTGREPVEGSAETGGQKAREAAIRQTLQQWAHAMVLNDPQAETVAYAPHLQRYFLRTDVDRAFVRADKEAYLRRGNRTASFTVEDVRFENETPDSADVRLIKDVAWERSADGVTHKLIRSELHLVRTGEGWKIAAERDFR